jgi:hypothetical protein
MGLGQGQGSYRLRLRTVRRPQPEEQRVLLVRCRAGARCTGNAAVAICWRAVSSGATTRGCRPDWQAGITAGEKQRACSWENVSRRGLGLRLVRPHTLCVHDVITVCFRLDEPQRSVVSIPTVVRWVDNERVGATLRDGDGAREAHRRLGMYVRAHTFPEKPRGAGPARAIEERAHAGKGTIPL